MEKNKPFIKTEFEIIPGNGEPEHIGHTDMQGSGPDILAMWLYTTQEVGCRLDMGPLQLATILLEYVGYGVNVRMRPIDSGRHSA